MKILLTGPFGTIGSHVLAALQAGGHEITCFDLDNKANRRAARRLLMGSAMVWGDITDKDAVAQAARGSEAIIHLAAIIPPLSESVPEIARAVNVGGTIAVIEAIKAQPNAPVLVFPSSVSVHGYPCDHESPCRASSRMMARDHYAGHKIECEEIVRNSDGPWVIVRIGACIDANNNKPEELSVSLTRLFQTGPDNKLEYLHPADAAIAMVGACNNADAIGKTLLLGGGKSSQTTWMGFSNIAMGAIGIGDLDASFFGNSDFYTDWMDTDESQSILQYQKNGLPAYRKEIWHKFRFIRPIVSMFRRPLRNKLKKFSQTILRS